MIVTHDAPDRRHDEPDLHNARLAAAGGAGCGTHARRRVSLSRRVPHSLGGSDSVSVVHALAGTGPAFSGPVFGADARTRHAALAAPLRGPDRRTIVRAIPEPLSASDRGSDVRAERAADVYPFRIADSRALARADA